MRKRHTPLPTDHDCGGTASKKPIDAAGAAAAMDGSSKSSQGGAAHTRLDASGAHSPLENRHTAAGLPQRQQASSSGSSTATPPSRPAPRLRSGDYLTPAIEEQVRARVRPVCGDLSRALADAARRAGGTVHHVEVLALQSDDVLMARSVGAPPLRIENRALQPLH